jgi:hypothetical protein
MLPTAIPILANFLRTFKAKQEASVSHPQRLLLGLASRRKETTNCRLESADGIIAKALA